MDDSATDWNAEAVTFDDEADHGLRDPEVRSAWEQLLVPLMPAAPATVADIGCGTGSIALLLAANGYQVTGVDLSPRMLACAHAKAAAAHRPDIRFVLGDAADPPLQPGTFDVVFARHILFLFNDADRVLNGWIRLLRPTGRLVLVEGFWSTGAGLTSEACSAVVRRHRSSVTVVPLSGQQQLWGKEVRDERYLVHSAE